MKEGIPRTRLFDCRIMNQYWHLTGRLIASEYITLTAIVIIKAVGNFA